MVPFGRGHVSDVIQHRTIHHSRRYAPGEGQRDICARGNRAQVTGQHLAYNRRAGALRRLNEGHAETSRQLIRDNHIGSRVVRRARVFNRNGVNQWIARRHLIGVVSLGHYQRRLDNVQIV